MEGRTAEQTYARSTVMPKGIAPTMRLKDYSEPLSSLKEAYSSLGELNITTPIRKIQPGR
jgi:hypothetical protein